MRKSRIFLKENMIIYDNKEIKDEIMLRKTKFRDNIQIIILDEELYIKKLQLYDKDEIISTINDSFGFNNDYLFHHYLVNGYLIIYAIKGGNRVLFIGQEAAKLKVTPIQIYIVHKLRKIITDEIFNILFRFRGNNYYISIYSGYITVTLVEKDIIQMEKKIIEIIDNGKIYIDKSIEYKILKNHVIHRIDLGEILDERRMFI